MTVVAFQAPGANQDGFVPLRQLQLVAQGMPAVEFADTFRPPALLVVDVSPDSAVADVSGGAPQLLTIADHGLEGLRYLDRVAFVAKRPGNPFSLFVSLGRSSSNDVVLGIDSVSKVHGYFTVADGAWHFTDRNSTNGTFLQGRRLKPSERVRLSAGDRLGFGKSLVVEFLPPDKLHERLLALPA